MARPVVSETAEALYDALGPWARADGENTQWALLHFCEATAGKMLQPLNDIVMDGDDGEPGWSIIMDADRAPINWLPWLGQLVGVRMIPGLTEDAMRLRVKSTGGFQRGTPGAIRAAARQFLIGPDGTPDSATVDLIERHGSAYRLVVSVLEAELAPGATADTIHAAILEQKPAGLVLEPTTVISGDNYLTLRDTNPSYTGVRGGYDDYVDVETPLD